MREMYLFGRENFGMNREGIRDEIRIRDSLLFLWFFSNPFSTESSLSHLFLHYHFYEMKEYWLFIALGGMFTSQSQMFILKIIHLANLKWEFFWWKAVCSVVVSRIFLLLIPSQTPLHLAIQKEKFEVFEILLQNGADIHAKTVRNRRK